MLIRWMTMFLDFPAEDFEPGARFWSQVTATRLSPPRGPEGEFATLLPETGDAYLRVQRLGAGGARCHLDLHLDPGELPEAARFATGLGARHQFHADDLEVFTSPGGHPFCLVPWEGENVVPGPVARPDSGHPSRLDQLCLDIPPGRWASETAFWAALTGWELYQNQAGSEFARLRSPSQLPLQLLLQRLDDEAPTVTSHPDFAARQRVSIAAAHTALGASVQTVSEHWTVMSDPGGRVYCLTGRDA